MAEEGPLTTNEEQQGAHNDLVKTLADENLKCIAGASAFYSAAMMGDYAAANARRNNAADAANALILNRLATTDPVEASALQKLATANMPERQVEMASGLAQSIAELNGVAATMAASIQQLAKIANTTPPVTP